MKRKPVTIFILLLTFYIVFLIGNRVYLEVEGNRFFELFIGFFYFAFLSLIYCIIWLLFGFYLRKENPKVSNQLYSGAKWSVIILASTLFISFIYVQTMNNL